MRYGEGSWWGRGGAFLFEGALINVCANKWYFFPAINFYIILFLFFSVKWELKNNIVLN